MVSGWHVADPADSAEIPALLLLNAGMFGLYRTVELLVMFSMKRIEHIEKHLPEKRRALLHCLRAHNWNAVEIDDTESDWALDEKWLIESTRENKGAALTLWMFKYDGLYDGMDRVVATPRDSPQPNAYGGAPAIEFDGPRFEKQLDAFIASLHEYRIRGNKVIQDGVEDQKT